MAGPFESRATCFEIDRNRFPIFMKETAHKREETNATTISSES